MKSLGILIALLASALGIPPLSAADLPQRLRGNDPAKVTPPRGEQVERPLGILEKACRKMHDLQRAVYDGTKPQSRRRLSRRRRKRSRSWRLKGRRSPSPRSSTKCATT